MKYALRTVRQNDAHDRLDLAYKMPDPWHMASPQEQARFAETNAVIARELGEHFGSLLEIGCGEGHQTEHLAALADASPASTCRPPRSSGRARRLPDADFAAGDVHAQPWAEERGRFELVTACEVIYYMSDMPRFLRDDGSPRPRVPGDLLRAGRAQGRGARRRDARRRAELVPPRRRRVDRGVVARAASARSA
jgi:hypothetical protein